MLVKITRVGETVGGHMVASVAKPIVTLANKQALSWRQANTIMLCETVHGLILSVVEEVFRSCSVKMLHYKLKVLNSKC